MTINYEIEFEKLLSEMTAFGLIVTEPIHFDEQYHRCPTQAKPEKQNGWYIACASPFYVRFGDWQTGHSFKWSPTSKASLSEEEKQAITKQRELAQREREQMYIEVAQYAKDIYLTAYQCEDNHPYLVKKGVKATIGLGELKNGKIVIPALDKEGEISTLQFIDIYGEKRFLPRGRKKGCSFPIGEPANKKFPLLIAEGYATGMSLHEATGYPVLVAFDAGNLLPVAEIARETDHERKIILCADNDIHPDKSSNTGIEKATAAARHIGGYLAIPNMTTGEKCDFNDLHQTEGLASVKIALDDATPVKHEAYSREPGQSYLDEDGQTLTTDGMPDGYFLGEGKRDNRPGLYFVKETKGEPEETWLSSPLYVEAKVRTSEQDGWGLLVRWKDPDGKQHTQIISYVSLNAKEWNAWIAPLVNEGWTCAVSKDAKTKVLVYLSNYTPPEHARIVNRTGWHEGVYVFPDSVIGEQEAVEPIRLQQSISYNPFQVGGTPEGWRNTIGTWAIGNSRLVFGISVALAAPLLGIVNHENFGISFTGSSSTGKTTVLQAAASCFGKGTSSNGYIATWRATANGLEGVAALHSDAPMCLDEIGQASSHAISEAVYMLANGTGKRRADTSGNARSVKNWRCVILSTGELGLADKIAEDTGKNAKEGQLVRLVDIAADAGAGYGIFEALHGFPSGQKFADAIKEAATQHYGHIARAFIQHVQAQQETIIRYIIEYESYFLDSTIPGVITGQVRRVAKHFALCAAAGELASNWGLVPWQPGTAFESAKMCFNAWIECRGGTETGEIQAGVSSVRRFLEQHGASRFQRLDTTNKLLDQHCRDRVGFRRDDSNGETHYYVLPESFPELCKGYDPKLVMQALAEKGLLIKGGADSFTQKLPYPLPEIGRKRCYLIKVSLESDE